MASMSDLEAIKAELRRQLERAYREYLRDPRRGGPDHMEAHGAWQEKRKAAQAQFQEQIRRGRGQE
jgi:hypothetical protein